MPSPIKSLWFYTRYPSHTTTNLGSRRKPSKDGDTKQTKSTRIERIERIKETQRKIRIKKRIFRVVMENHKKKTNEITRSRIPITGHLKDVEGNQRSSVKAER